MKKEHVIVLVSSIIVALVSSSLFMLKKKKKVNKKNNGRKQYLLNLIKKFNPNIKIENAVTPPAQWYTNEVLFELEKKEIVMKSWHPVANIGQLNNVGDYISSEILGVNYFLIVDRDKKIRAFYNTCRHKASKLVDTGIESSKGAKPKGNIKDIVCPYHGWHYSLDGKLVNARKMSNSIINYDDFCLYEINVHIWSIFVFINFDKTAKWIENSFSELEKRLSDSGLDKLTFHSSKVDIIDCNWKVYVDNYLDGGYHVPILHKALTAQLSMDSYTTDIFENYSIQSVKGGCDRIGKAAIYGYIYPNFMINRYGPVCDTNYVVPISKDKCAVVFDFYFDRNDKGVTEQFINDSILSSDKTQIEDVQVSESVQKGLHSSVYNIGRYAKGVEEGELHFHRLLYFDYLKACGNDDNNNDNDKNIEGFCSHTHECSLEGDNLSW